MLDCCLLCKELRLCLCYVCQRLCEFIYLLVQTRALGLLAGDVSKASSPSVVPLTTAFALMILRLLLVLVVSRCIAVH